jgi:hypothetical protein
MHAVPAETWCQHDLDFCAAATNLRGIWPESTQETQMLGIWRTTAVA